MGAVESVLREVEKVTIRPLGEVAREVEKVTVRPLGEVARGVEKATIRPLGEIARELEKLTIRPLGEVARGLEKATIRPLGEIARDLERLLVRPIGGFASRTLLLMGRLIDVVDQESSVVSPTNIQAKKEKLDKMAEDALELERDINEAIAETPVTKEDDLRCLGEMHKVAIELRCGITQAQDNTELMMQNAELMEDNSELIQYNTELVQNNEELIQGMEEMKELRLENQELRDRLNFLEAGFRNAIENNGNESGYIHIDSNSDDDRTIPSSFA